jgi:hypothetical protein
LIRTAWNFAFKKDETEYSLHGRMHVTPVDEPHDTINVIIRSNSNRFSKVKGS